MGEGQDAQCSGFTLIELSIVLVIIGLIVGSVLVGQDLVSAAAVRATVAQIDRYNAAVNTFRIKFNELPGDIDAATAKQFGFKPRGQYAGMGDGNGVIEGISNSGPGNNVYYAQGAGEAGMFWVDLTSANGLNLGLVDGSFSAALPDTKLTGVISSTGIERYMPSAKLGGGNYIYAYGLNSVNYFGIGAVQSLNQYGGDELVEGPGLRVWQAFAIDAKIDDGLPQSGSVTTQYITCCSPGYIWAMGGPLGSAGDPPGSSTAASVLTCFDNAGAGGVEKYSVNTNSGKGVNCALSVQFQ